MTEIGSAELSTIAATVHGRYWVVPAADGAQGSPLLVGCHGYGETAREHLDELRSIPGSEGWTLCAVDALHPFYKRSTGEVVRSWMTKEDREQTIEDNILYLSSVVGTVRGRHGADRRLVFSGFSQGVAMAWRAAVRCGFPCHGIMVLAGDVPSEVPIWAEGRLPPVLLGRGTRDEWYSEGKMDADLAVLEQHGTQVTPCVFSAGHVWTDEYRRAAGQFLTAALG